jgi:hypothetical protein
MHAPRPTCWLAKCVCGRPRQGALGSGCGARARLESRRAALDRTCWQHRQSGPAAHRGLLVPVPSERGGREKIGLARARPSHPQQGKASPCGLASDLTVVIPSHRRPRVSHAPTRPRSRGAGSIRFPRAGRLDSLADSSRFFSTSSSLYFFPSPPARPLPPVHHQHDAPSAVVVFARAHPVALRRHWQLDRECSSRRRLVVHPAWVPSQGGRRCRGRRERGTREEEG